MNLRAILGNALQGAASALGNVTQQTPATNPPPKTSSAHTGTLTDKQVKEIAEHIVAQRAQPSLFEEHVKQIDPQVVERRHIYDQPVMVELPKPAEKMTKPDYDQAFARAVLKKAGMTDAKDAEVAKFRNEYRRVTGGKFELTWNEQQLRAYQQQHGNQLPAHTNEYGLSVADAGMRQIHADRQEYAVRVEQRRKEAQAYGTDALTGFYEVQINAPLNLINDATKVVGLPEIPKFDVGGEYWADKKQVAEAATTAGAAVLTGGAGLAGDLLIIGSSAGNMAEATMGTDFRTGEQLSTTDRVLRGAMGAAGAYAVRGRVDEITEGVAARVQNATKPTTNAAEAITTEGVLVRVPVKEELLVSTHQKMTSVDSSGRASGLRFRNDYIEHVSKRDYSVPRTSGIGGAHNLDEFNKYLHEINVISRTPHPTLRGVERIEYQIPALDRTGKPTGDWVNRVFRKTVYDPAVISDKQMMEWGRQAFAEAQAAGRINPVKREWTGYAPNGIKFFGHIDAHTGSVRTFFPEF